MRVVERIMAHSLAAASTVAHKYPQVPGVPWMEGKITGLTEPDDLRLRWRVGTYWTGSKWDWLQIPGTDSATQHNTTTWKPSLVAVERTLVEAQMLRSIPRRVAVAYRMAPLATDSVIMVGVNERQPEVPLLTPVTRDGTPNPNGAMLAAIVRTGNKPNTVAIGTVGPDPTDIEILPIEIIPGSLMPEGVHRV